MGLLCGAESSGICCCSVTQPCLTLYNSIDESTPGSSVLHCLLEFARIHVRWVSDHLILCHPLLLLPSVFPSIRVFSNELALHIMWPRYWNFSFSISPSNEYSGLIYFMIDWFDLLAVQRTLKSLLWHHSSKASILWCSVFLIMWRNSSKKNEEAGMMGTGDWFLGLIFACDVNLFPSFSCSCLQEHWNTCSGPVVVLALVT